jgi:hypothetical protein
LAIIGVARYRTLARRRVTSSTSVKRWAIYVPPRGIADCS